MLRVITALLILITSTAIIANTGYPFLDLRNELSLAETKPEQRAIVERMREAHRDGTGAGNHVGMLVYVLARKPILNEAATISFLQELIASPESAEAATTAIAYQFSGDKFSASALETFAAELSTYQRQTSLSDEAAANLQNAFSSSAPQANREYALSILMLRPPDGDKREKFLTAVSYLVDPEMSVSERRAAIDIFIAAAEDGPLPGHANQAIHRTALGEPDAALRVSAWPLAMRKKYEQRESDRSSHYFFGAKLNEQLIAPVTDTKPSFVDADEHAREQAVALLNDYWHPEYHAEYIDILIELVKRHGSPTSMEKLLELRQINALNDEQLITLSRINSDNPAIAQYTKTISTPNLAEGSLMGPMEVLANSNDTKEWQRATEQLLAQYPSGTVPTAVAEAAYRVVENPDLYDAAAVDLFVRGDMPFVEQEAKVLKLVDRTPQSSGYIIRALRHLHGDVDTDFLVRRYVNDQSIDRSFRGGLLSTLYAEVRESGQLDAETTTAVADFARTTDSYFSASTAMNILEAAGAPVPLTIRLKQKDFQWTVLTWAGLLSLAVGISSGLYALVLVAIPGKWSGLRGRQRAIGLVTWLILVALFLAAALWAALHSIGHNSTPPPDKAFPWYVATMIVAALLLLLAFTLGRKRAVNAEV